GGTDQDEGHAIAVDSSGNAYVTGSTRSSNFPTTPNPFRADQPGGDAFVTKLSKGGSLVFSTYLGGTGDDTASSIAVDSLLNVYVTGETTSGNVPDTKRVQCDPEWSAGRFCDEVQLGQRLAGVFDLSRWKQHRDSVWHNG